MPQKKKKPRKVVNARLKAFSGALRSSDKPFSVISNHRKRVSPSEYSEFYDTIQKNYLSSVFSYKLFVPQEIDYILGVPPFKKIPLFDELRWSLVRIQKEIKNIKKFTEYSAELNKNLVQRNFEDGSKTLNKIDSEICRSAWSTAKRQAVLQQIGGLDANKEYTNNLLEKENPTSIFAFLISAISSRNEDAIDINWMQTRYFSVIENSNVDKGLREYLYYSLYRPMADVYDYNDLISVSGTASLIDLYECFVFTLSKLVSDVEFPNKNILFLLNQINDEINDFRLKKIAYLLTEDEKYLNDFEFLDSEFFDLTRSKKSYKYEELDKNYNVLGGIHYEMNSAKYLLDNDVTPNNENILNYWKVFQKDDDFYSYYYRVIKKSIDAAPTGNEFIVKNFIKTELSSNPFCEEDCLDCLEFIYSDYIAPTHVLCLPNKKIKKRFLSFLNNFYDNSLICKNFSDIFEFSNDEDNFKNEYKLISIIEKNFSKEPNISAEAALKLSLSKNLRMRRYGSRYYAFFLLQSKKFKEALEFIGTNLIEDHGSRFTLPIERVGEILDKEHRKEFADIIDVSIILYFLNRGLENDDDRRIIYAYEDFLRSYKVAKPSDVNFEKMSSLQLKKFIFFLQKVCSHIVISNSIVFESDSEVEDERVKIYRMLKVLDPLNEEQYEKELEQILKDQAIRNVKKHIEQSKIYVDVDKIRLWADKNLKISFNRYISFVEAGMGPQQIDTESDITIQEKVISSLEDMVSRDSGGEAFGILTEIVRKLMSEFYHNSAYGLDSYLSVRVRHGWISAQLREPFSKNSIITQKSSNSEKYESNKKWVDYFNSTDDDIGELDNILGNFSAKVDKIIEDLAKESIQICSKEHPNGLIQIGIPAYLVAVIASDIKPDQKFNSFLDHVFSIFWTITTGSLKNIRSYIEKDISDQLTEAINDLETSIRHIDSDGKLIALQSSINLAIVDMQDAISRLSSWFVVSEGFLQEPVLVQDIINAALSSVSKGHSETISPHIIFNIPDFPIMLMGNNISVFNDICFIIFENIMKHSGLTGQADIKIDINVEEHDFKVEISNFISEDIDTKKQELVLNNIRASIKDGSYIKKMNQEGETGLRKLKQLITDMKSESEDSLSFGIRKEKKEFFVKFKIKASWMNEKDINN